jgi:ribosome modulation factor
MTDPESSPAERAYANGYMDGLTTDQRAREGNVYTNKVERAAYSSGFKRGRRERNGDPS